MYKELCVPRRMNFGTSLNLTIPFDFTNISRINGMVTTRTAYKMSRVTPTGNTNQAPFFDSAAYLFNEFPADELLTVSDGVDFTTGVDVVSFELPIQSIKIWEYNIPTQPASLAALIRSTRADMDIRTNLYRGDLEIVANRANQTINLSLKDEAIAAVTGSTNITNPSRVNFLILISLFGVQEV